MTVKTDIQDIFDDNPEEEEEILGMEGEEGEGEVESQAEESEEEEVQQPSGGISPDDLHSIVASAVKSVTTPAAPAAKEMTVEEFRALSKYYGVTPKDLQEILGAQEDIDPKRATALQKVLDAVTTHNMTMTQQMLGMLEDKLMQQLKPIQHASAEQAKTSWTQKFCASTPGLEKSQKLVNLAIDQLARSGYKPQGEAQDRATVLQVVNAISSAAGRPLNVKVQQSQGGAVQRRARGNMPGTINGGGGGGSVAGQQGKKVSAAAEVYGYRK